MLAITVEDVARACDQILGRRSKAAEGGMPNGRRMGSVVSDFVGNPQSLSPSPPAFDI